MNEIGYAVRDTSKPARQNQPWIFGITNLPFGVAGTYAAVAMPFFLRKAGLDVGTIAALAALALVPAVYQFLWAPILDLGIRRRAWLVLMSILGGLLLGASMLVKLTPYVPFCGYEFFLAFEHRLPENIVTYEVLLVLGQAFVGLVASCNGALVSTALAENLRGRAAGYVNAANLGSSALGGGVVLWLANSYGIQAAAYALTVMIIVPSFAAFYVVEPPPAREPVVAHLSHMARDVWKAVRAKKGWTGLLFCISPVGTVALGNLFSALGPDYHVSDQTIEMVNGFAGGLVTAAGALASGFILDRVDRRHAYLASGILTAICAIGMALAPQTPSTYIVGCMIYLAITGLAYAAFSAVVYEIVGTAGSTAATLYSVFPAAGNQAIVYTLWLDGKANGWWGTRGCLWADAVLNILGVLALLLMLRLVFEKPQVPLPEDDILVPEAAPAATVG